MLQFVRGVGDLLATLYQKLFAVACVVYGSEFSHESVRVAHGGPVTVAVRLSKLKDLVERDWREIEAHRLTIQGNQALRISGGSEGVEERPVGFAGVEQGSDPVVGEVGESEGDAFDAFDQVVGGLGGCVGDSGGVPVGDLVSPVPDGASQPVDLSAGMAGSWRSWASWLTVAAPRSASPMS